MKFCIHIGILTSCSPWDCQMTFLNWSRFCRGSNSEKSENWLLNCLEYFDKFLQTNWCWKDLAHLLLVEALPSAKFWKKWVWPCLLNWVEYFDKHLHKHWYWQVLAQEIVNWHFFSVEALPSSKFWKSENGPISRTVKNIVMKFCIHTVFDKM